MKSVQEVLQLSTQFLAAKNIASPRRLVEELLAHLLRCKRIDIYMQFDRPIDERELATLRAWVMRVANHEPVEYVTGEVDFYGCKIKVDARVLIPRVETELLVDFAAKKISGEEVLWDLCTGSGYIGIALKKKFPKLAVAISDISLDALTLAQENAAQNKVEIEAVLGDLLTPFRGRKADVIVCNPPYVSAKEFVDLDSSVRDFEPKLALVGGATGLEFYERLARELPAHLNPGGKIFLEIGAAQGASVKNIFNGEGTLLKDLSGKDRFFFLEKQ